MKATYAHGTPWWCDCPGCRFDGLHAVYGDLWIGWRTFMDYPDVLWPKSQLAWRNILPRVRP